MIVNGGVDALAGGLGANPATLPLGIAIAAGTPALTESLPSGSPANYESIDQEIIRGAERFQLPVAQGLISSGTLPAPLDRSWFRGGVIRIRNEDEAKNFEKWWTTSPRSITQYEELAKVPYNDATRAVHRPD